MFGFLEQCNEYEFERKFKQTSCLKETSRTFRALDRSQYGGVFISKFELCLC